MQISTVTQALTTELRKTTFKKVDQVKPHAQDQASFSKEALQLNDSNTVLPILGSQPDIRIDKIEEVKRKVELGYYNSDEFLDKLVDKLIAGKLLF